MTEVPTSDHRRSFASDEAFDSSVWAKISVWLDRLFRLSTPLAPGEVDAIQLEDRILYSATPLAILDGGTETPPNADFSAEMIEQAKAFFDLEFQHHEGLVDISSENGHLVTEQEGVLSGNRSDTNETMEGEQSESIVLLKDTFSPKDVFTSFESVQEGDSTIYDVLVIDRFTDGLDQLESLLAEYDQLDAIHTFNEGGEQGVAIGGDWIDFRNVLQFDLQFPGEGESLAVDGDVLFYVIPAEDATSGELARDRLVNQLDASTNADGVVQVRDIDQSLSESTWAYDYQSGHVDSYVLVAPPLLIQGESDRLEVVFVDAGLEDYESLVRELSERERDGIRTLVFEINANFDGLAQVNDLLSTLNEPINAIHFLNHGTEHAFKLGSTWFDYSAVVAREAEFNAWSGVLAPDGDILFYACELASSPVGVSLLELIGDYTDADIAASSNATGYAGWGG
ncbi:MAG: DUF4347 domain-containing protein, partial [Pirellula sp.]|nr:DUF4347 domain-containing protein [Pirellula sp.]